MNLSLLAGDNWDGEQYSNNSSLQERWAHELFEKLTIQPGDTVLDLGTGDGKNLIAFAHLCPNNQFFGVDNSESMLAQAHMFLEESALENISFAYADIESFSLEQEFDWVISYSTLHWIKDMSSACHNISQHVKSGGRFFFYFCPAVGKVRPDISIERVKNLPKWSKYFVDAEPLVELCTPFEFHQFAQESGLEVDRFEVIEVNEPFESRLHFQRWMASWLSYLKYLPDDLKDEFLSEIIDDYIEKNPLLEDGTLIYKDYWMEVEGLKI